MNFRGHFIGGIITASGMAILGAGYFGISTPPLPAIPLLSVLSETKWILPLLLFFITLFMSLFPDLDVASLAQRWFYRVIFLGLILLILLNQFRWSGLISLVAITPLLHKHRGWTHWKITPWFMAVFFIFLWDFSHESYSWEDYFNIQRIFWVIQNSWFIILAFIAGHYTHLILDKVKPA